MDVLITGASGTIGTALQTHLDNDLELTLLDLVGDNSEIADIRNFGEIRPYFNNQDAVIHLAVHPLADDNWNSILETNIIGTHNVLKAANEAEVDIFIFGSSNHCVGLYERMYAPEIYFGEVDITLDNNTPPRPDSFYGVSKSFGENLIDYYTNYYQYPIASHSIRICSVHDAEHDHPYSVAERGVQNGDWERGSAAYRLHVARQKAMWLSRRDCAQLFQKCLISNIKGHNILYGVSDNECRWVDIKRAKNLVEYLPKDSADNWDEPPTKNIY